MTVWRRKRSTRLFLKCTGMAWTTRWRMGSVRGSMWANGLTSMRGSSTCALIRTWPSFEKESPHCPASRRKTTIQQTETVGVVYSVSTKQIRQCKHNLRKGNNATTIVLTTVRIATMQLQGVP
ncbi:hypothetical protein K474DRAFT_1473804 [Panus rudis PR-1116 ss-1]|nr:hypothetical protein K474DRAFT_1473804 [Panus rudis PR-1116 ss-1]